MFWPEIVCSPKLKSSAETSLSNSPTPFTIFSLRKSCFHSFFRTVFISIAKFCLSFSSNFVMYFFLLFRPTQGFSFNTTLLEEFPDKTREKLKSEILSDTNVYNDAEKKNANTDDGTKKLEKKQSVEERPISIYHASLRIGL